MVLLPDGRQKIRAKARAEGYAEGFAQGWAIGFAQGLAEGRAKAKAFSAAKELAAWRRWNARRLEFEARGEPFDEPPPDYADYLSGDEPKRGD